MPNIRGGVEIDADGAPVAYHIREAHIGDWWSGAKTMTWRRIPRETAWGRPHVVHDFDHERGAQHRGNGILTPVVQRLKMLVKYDQSELEAAILNAIFAAYIESPYDPEMIQSALGENFEEGLGAYQDGRAEFHNDRRLTLQNGARMPILYPGERITTVNAARPYSNFEVFESAVLRNFSSGILDPAFNYGPLAYAPKSWVKEDPAQRLILMQSSPLVIPSRVNASLCATVV